MPLQRRLLGVNKERPSENFELNKDSPQAQNLKLWYPLTRPGNIRNYAGAAEARGTLQGSAAFTAKQYGYGVNTNAASSYVDVGDTGITLSYPLTYISFLHLDSIGGVGYISRFVSRSTDLIGSTTESAGVDVAYFNFDGNGWQWETGPNCIAGQLSIEIVTLYGSSSVDAWVVTPTGYYSKGSESRARTKTTAVVDDLDLGNDELAYATRYLRGTIYDIRVLERQYTDADVEDLLHNLWDLYWCSKVMVPGISGLTPTVTGGGSSGRTRYTFLDPVPDEEDPEFVRKLQFTVGQSRGALDRRAAFARHALKIISGGK